jgi:hypothetical protein
MSKLCSYSVGLEAEHAMRYTNSPHREIQVEVKVTLRLTSNQLVYLDVEPTLKLVTRNYFLSKGC